MADVLWYYARNDQQFGPVSASELKQLVDAGGLSPDDLLWREGMDAWTTAVNLRGLFSEDSPASGRPSGARPSSPGSRADMGGGESSAPESLRSMLRALQVILWSMCVLVVLAGVVLFTRAFLAAKGPADEAAAGAVYSAFFIGAYVLARCGEKLSKLLLDVSKRRGR